jgi:hypothetical protein
MWFLVDCGPVGFCLYYLVIFYTDTYHPDASTILYVVSFEGITLSHGNRGLQHPPQQWRNPEAINYPLHFPLMPAGTRHL